MGARRYVRASLLLACAPVIALSSACSSEPGTPSHPETVTSPTTPDPTPTPTPADTVADAPVTHSSLAASPSCGAEGSRVMLRLDWTADMRVPVCLVASEFDVRFGSKAAVITKLGKMNEGWCALDVLVPKGAGNAPVTVTIGHDEYASPTAFASPCP